ncbi:VWA domain-containing protein [Thiolapillus sp.]
MEVKCNYREVKAVLEDCLEEVNEVLSPEGVKSFVDGLELLCMMGRGAEPVLVYMEEAAEIARHAGEQMVYPVARTAYQISRSPNAEAIVPFLQGIAEIARRLEAAKLLQGYLDIVLEMVERTSISIHGSHATMASPGLVPFLQKAPMLLGELTIGGLKRWMDYGIAQHNHHPDHLADFFSLESADSRAVMQRERHGTLLVDVERRLDLFDQALWRIDEAIYPYSRMLDERSDPRPYYDDQGIFLPDVHDDLDNGISGMDQYRAALAHMAGHRRWTAPVFADNRSPMQRIAIEVFEDSRIEYLLMQEYPGLRRIFLGLHPKPVEDECDEENESCVRHRLTMLSRAILDPDHGYRNPVILDFVARFFAIMERGNTTTMDMETLGIQFMARTRRQSDALPNVWFKDTEISYRDDNRNLWQFYELDDDEDFHVEPTEIEEAEPDDALPPRHYPEWDYTSQTYRPDWASVYETLHPSGDAAYIDGLLRKHDRLAKQIKRMLDLLKPQNYQRIRYQEEGSELDLDIAIRSLIDFKSGHDPDPRINVSHKHNDRNIAVTILLDLSESLSQTVGNTGQTILELEQEAVSLLAWAIEQLGDTFAIAGFHSNTRHEVRYYHIKGFSEHWNLDVKSRLAAMGAGYSTRMGAAMRHAGHYLEHQKADKKLLLVLTDGEPADIDVRDERHLIEDSRMAVRELDQLGIYSYCINLDPRADEYVADIFGKQYSIIDNIESLPEKLPKLFLALTK